MPMLCETKTISPVIRLGMSFFQQPHDLAFDVTSERRCPARLAISTRVRKHRHCDHTRWRMPPA